eukprot:NODE_901_length_3188_cov_1.051797.p2 type:complete len:134 gc:universal NODE_901_length_3188_cov_1.051797:2308-2709(+)
MLFIQFVLSASVNVCWTWAYYYYQKGQLTSDNYYSWIANCCVYGTQPSTYSNGRYVRTNSLSFYPLRPSKIPLNIPDTKVDDGDPIVSVNEIKYNKNNKRIYKYMRENCAAKLPKKPDSNNERRLTKCLDSYE